MSWVFRIVLETIAKQSSSSITAGEKQKEKFLESYHTLELRCVKNLKLYASGPVSFGRRISNLYMIVVANKKQTEDSIGRCKNGDAKISLCTSLIEMKMRLKLFLSANIDFLYNAHSAFYGNFAVFIDSR
ncbi:hypothetical protein CEXT_10411 [Caerostris extrusa]|uniref:Uncharacterized protein n=1 Tax=Caerostris extrusa TaxID=172846 RepID=A0AAV4M2U2_CAEEX|nr:hypothetical protein CEXT_10411 [Caerostris extrusa]